MIVTKEELEKIYPDDKTYESFYHNEELDKKCEDIRVRVEFEVTCDSSPYVGDGNSIKQRLQNYVKQCYDAMDDSMRHWGDHEHCIDPIKVTLFREDDEGNDLQQDVTDEILGE